MKRILFLTIIFIPVCANAQFRYSLSFDPIGLHKQNEASKIFQLYNLKFSIKTDDEVFYLELQPGIVLNGIIPHIDFNLGGQFKAFYLKAGVLYYFEISGGGMSGTSVVTGFLPNISPGIFITEKFFAEGSFNLAFFSIGVGYNF